MLGPDTPHCSYDAARVGYTFVRHIGLILDELSSPGLAIWQDEQHRWHWRWIGTTLQSARGFWALGEAVVDAVVIPIRCGHAALCHPERSEGS
jgi:hypothetical protein